MLTYNKPLPPDDPLFAPFWANARSRRLSIQCCRACGDRRFPPGPVCPRCLSEDQDWDTVSGRGTLVSWVRFHRAYWAGFVQEIPYECCLVQLDEGPLLVSNFAGPPPAPLRSGLPLRVVFEDITDRYTLPKFVAA